MNDDEAGLADRAAAELAAAGFPRIPAQVVMALTVHPEGRLTAAELSDLLQASPAAISGAVRYLRGLGMVSTGTVPGTRRHAYTLPPLPWYAATLIEDRNAPLVAVLEGGVGDLPAGPGRERVAEMIGFFRFLRAEMPPLWERWRAELRDDG